MSNGELVKLCTCKDADVFREFIGNAFIAGFSSVCVWKISSLEQN